MSISATIGKLQGLHATVTGIKSARTAFPSVLNTAVLPIALTWAGEAQWDLQALNLYRQDRTYIVRVYVQPVAQDIAGVDNGFTDTIALINAVGLKYVGDMTLTGSIDHIASISDSGIKTLTWAGTDYWGFEFTLAITEKTT